MKKIKTEILIDAPIEKVWSVLTDFKSYPAWNPFILKIEGQLQINSQLAVNIHPPGQKPMTFSPKIVKITEHAFCWIGSLGISGIFDGRHSFILEPVENKTRFLHSESFSGFLHMPIFALINKATKAGFENMNTALKNRCESALS